MAPTTRRSSSGTVLNAAVGTRIVATSKTMDVAPTARKNHRAAFSDVSNTKKNAELPPRAAARVKKPTAAAAAPPAGGAVRLVDNNKTKHGGKQPRRSARFQPLADAATTTTIDASSSSSKNNSKNASTKVAAAATVGGGGGDQGNDFALSSKYDIPCNKKKPHDDDRRKSQAAAATKKKDHRKSQAATAAAATTTMKSKVAATVKEPPAAKPAPRGRTMTSFKPAAAQRKKSDAAHNNNNKKRSRRSTATTSSLRAQAPADESCSSPAATQEPPTKVRRKSRLQRDVKTPHRHLKPAVQHSHNLNVSSSPFVFDSEAYTADVADHDAVNLDNVLEAPEYVTDIYQRLFHTEMNYVPEPYTNERRGISHVMRYALVNRLVEVHRKCQLDNETLHLCVNIIDRYCAIKNNARGGHNKVTKRSFHLVGLTALLIASKYEEIYAFPISYCVKLCDEQYDAQDVLDMEYDILQALDYRISGPTAFPFLQRFLHLTNATNKMSYAATYYLERALHLESFLNFRPSLVAAAAVCLAINNPDIRRLDRRRCRRVGIPPLLLEYTGFDATDIYRAATMIEQELVDAIIQVDEEGYPLNAAKKKFALARYQRIAAVTKPPRVEDILLY